MFRIYKDSFKDRLLTVSIFFDRQAIYMLHKKFEIEMQYKPAPKAFGINAANAAEERTNAGIHKNHPSYPKLF